MNIIRQPATLSDAPAYVLYLCVWTCALALYVACEVWDFLSYSLPITVLCLFSVLVTILAILSNL